MSFLHFMLYGEKNTMTTSKMSLTVLNHKSKRVFTRVRVCVCGDRFVFSVLTPVVFFTPGLFYFIFFFWV